MKRAKFFGLGSLLWAAAAIFALSAAALTAASCRGGELSSAETAVTAATLSDTVAEEQAVYARASTRESYFFAEKDLASSLFAVPYTYCVEVLGSDGDWYSVRYAEDVGLYRAVYGYCLKEQFELLDGVPSATYLYKTVQVTYTADESLSPLPVLNEMTVDAAYYGVYYAGATAYSYVLCNGSFGYITGANDDYALNTADDASDGEEESGNDDLTSRIVTAAVLTALAVATLALLIYTAGKHGAAHS